MQQHEEILQEQEHAEPNRWRMQELHQADHLEQFSSEWQEIDTNGVRQCECDQNRRADDKTELEPSELTGATRRRNEWRLQRNRHERERPCRNTSGNDFRLNRLFELFPGKRYFWFFSCFFVEMENVRKNIFEASPQKN